MSRRWSASKSYDCSCSNISSSRRSKKSTCSASSSDRKRSMSSPDSDTIEIDGCLVAFCGSCCWCCRWSAVADDRTCSGRDAAAAHEAAATTFARRADFRVIEGVCSMIFSRWCSFFFDSVTPTQSIYQNFGSAAGLLLARTLVPLTFDRGMVHNRSGRPRKKRSW